MNLQSKKMRVGIVGCGAIGSRMALSVKKDLSKVCTLSGLFDTDPQKYKLLSKKFSPKKLFKESLNDLIKNSDIIVEAVSAPQAAAVIKKVLQAKKDLLCMSVGQAFQNPSLVQLAQKNRCSLLIPSGAIAGVDAIKAASSVPFKKIILTTRKPPAGLENSPFMKRKGINLSKIKKETVIYSGSVKNAVKNFPKNINVAATIALACGQSRKLKVRILTSPKFKGNSHEIEMIGSSGKIVTQTQNVPCPDNPKTSYLAALSGAQLLKQFCSGLLIGT